MNKLWINLRKFASKLHHILFLFFTLLSLFSIILDAAAAAVAALLSCCSSPNKRQIEKHVCTPEEFTCKSSDGECVPMSWVCDGNPDCSNGSDETTCSECFVWKKFYFTCFFSLSLSLFHSIEWKISMAVKSNSFRKLLFLLMQIKLVAPMNLLVATVAVFRYVITRPAEKFLPNEIPSGWILLKLRFALILSTFSIFPFSLRCVRLL